jgi:hypothetical protein
MMEQDYHDNTKKDSWNSYTTNKVDLRANVGGWGRNSEVKHLPIMPKVLGV